MQCIVTYDIRPWSQTVVPAFYNRLTDSQWYSQPMPYISTEKGKATQGHKRTMSNDLPTVSEYDGDTFLQGWLNIKEASGGPKIMTVIAWGPRLQPEPNYEGKGKWENRPTDGKVDVYSLCSQWYEGAALYMTRIYQLLNQNDANSKPAKQRHKMDGLLCCWSWSVRTGTKCAQNFTSGSPGGSWWTKFHCVVLP